MDPVLIHLRVNHFPIILGIVGAVASVLALVLWKREAIWRYAAITTLLAGLSAPIAYWSGERAEDAASDYENIDLGAMTDHEESATWALIGLLAAGAAGALTLAKPTKATRILLVLCSVGAVGVTANTSAQAGKIVHNDDTQGVPR